MENEKRLIDKEKLLDKLCWLAKNEDQFRQSVIGGVMHTIAVTPTVEAVEVVHGRWIHDCVEGCNPFVDSLPIWVDVMQCSVCKEYIEGSHGTNYCPNCGADMRERKDNERKASGVAERHP